MSMSRKYLDDVGDTMFHKVVIGWTFDVCFDMQEKKAP